MDFRKNFLETLILSLDLCAVFTCDEVVDAYA